MKNYRQSSILRMGDVSGSTSIKIESPWAIDVCSSVIHVLCKTGGVETTGQWNQAYLKNSITAHSLTVLNV